MSGITIVSGILLVLIGAGGYFASESRSVTALIPAFVGLPLLLLGLLAMKDSLRKHAMHFAAMLGVLGFLAAGGRLGMVLAKGGGSTLGIGSLAAMAVVCLVFTGLCVKSFIDVRKARERAAAGSGD